MDTVTGARLTDESTASKICLGRVTRVPQIFDNTANETRLGTSLQNSLAYFQGVDVATGYLDLRGWAGFADLVDSKSDAADTNPVARVLVGMVMPSDAAAMLATLQDQVQPPQYGSDLNDPERALAAKHHLVRHLRTQLMRGVPNAAEQRTLRQLGTQLESGAVQMRVFTDAPLHGKTYIFRSPDNPIPTQRLYAYVGSSNLTAAGHFRNLELNVDVTDLDATTKLAGWFEARWGSRFSLPITTDLIELIEESWAAEQQPTPYEVYLKVCHSMSEDAREGMGYVLPALMKDILLDYQETAVRTLARRIVRRGGTMLGDVVGLGKTLTAIATALMLENAEDFTTLVLCPKNLEAMWTEHLERFGLVGARVVPYSMVDRKLAEMKRFHLVICDESHNLRNSSTRASEAIKEYVRRNGSKVLLLTATPYNLAFADVANQIGLYIDDDEDLGIQPTEAMAKYPNLRDKVDGKVNTLRAFRESEEPEDWKRLMSDHLVRRTRSFVKRTAAKETIALSDGGTEEREYLQFANGERFHFPRREPRPLSLDFADDDPAKLMEDDETLDNVGDLSLPRYRLADYDDLRKPHTAEDSTILDDIRSGRGNVSGFVRMGLFKRLSSSGHSFILSLQRQRARNELFIYAIDNKLAVPLGTIADQLFAVTDKDLEDVDEPAGSMAIRYEHLRERLPASTKWLNSTILKPSLRKDLDRDNRIITGMLDRYGTWDPSRDSKLNALVDLLTTTHTGQKVLVFTEYVDTADYVAGALAAAGIERVAVASGSSSEEPALLARRFSPESNKLPGEDDPNAAPRHPAGEPIDVLVATDVLSEGQNLQDSHVVVNYDLPWAIIRIIQRAGRVDRVGQRSDVVYVYLITHEKVEQAIQLRQRIRRRLGDSAAAFGSDERFFGDDREINILDDLYAGTMPNEDEFDSEQGEADAVSEAWLVWSRVKDKETALAARIVRMQDMIHTTRAPRMHERRTGVACYASTASGVDAFAISETTESGVNERLLTPLEALHIFRADPTTPTVEMREDHYEREASLIREKLTVEMVAAGNLRGLRKWVVDRLGQSLFGTDAALAIGAMMERPLTEYANNQLRQARRSKLHDQDLAELVRHLHDEERLVIGTSDKDDITIVCSIGVSDL